MEEKKLILLEEGNCISDNIKEICSIYNQNSFSDFYATNIETVKNMVRINNGAALLPKLSCLDSNNLKTFSFSPKKFYTSLLPDDLEKLCAVKGTMTVLEILVPGHNQSFLPNRKHMSN